MILKNILILLAVASTGAYAGFYIEQTLYPPTIISADICETKHAEMAKKHSKLLRRNSTSIVHEKKSWGFK